MSTVNKTFATFFPAYEDFHFFKDPGQVPFRFSKLGYSAKIISRKNGNYPETTKRIGMDFIEKEMFLGKDISLVKYFRNNSKYIDILNVFHLDSWETLYSSFLYKFFNPKGFVYMKMDNCHNAAIYPWEKIFDNSVSPSYFLGLPKETLKWKVLKILIRKIFIKKIDLWSVEDLDSKLYFEKRYSFFKNKIVVAYNGHTIDLEDAPNSSTFNFDKKGNTIVTVARLGVFPKNTNFLLEGYACTAKEHDWDLILAGPIVPDFKIYIDAFFIRNPELKTRIIFCGNLEKKDLFELYNRSKIFLLPSFYEGFAIVYAEAMFFGNAIITTPNTSVKTIIEENDLGLLIERNNSKELGEAILDLVKNEAKIKQMGINARKFAMDNLSWDIIASKLKIEIDRRSV